MHASRVGILLLVAALLLVFAHSAQTTAEDKNESGGLFREAPGDPPPAFGVETLAARLVGIDFGQLAQVLESPASPEIAVAETALTPYMRPQALTLNMFDDAVYTGLVKHVEPTASGHAMWGGLEGVELGTMALVVNGDVVVGTVRTPEAVYTIRTVAEGKYVVRQIDESTLPPPAEPLEDHSHAPEESISRPQNVSDLQRDDSGPRDDGSVIDVMVVYTPQARTAEGGRAAMEALIDLFVAETNQAYANSEVTHRIRLVHREEVDYIEKDSGDLFRLANDSDGYMDSVHVLRDQYAADLVHLITSTGYGVYCGIANLGPRESAVFGITVRYCGGLVFAHELGHNMGLHHDRYVVRAGRAWSVGYVNQRMFEPGAPESARWRTVMAYRNQCADVDIRCPRIPYFSNPRLEYLGDPLGVPADHPSTGLDGPADAVRALNDNRHFLANLRQSESSPSPRAHLVMSSYWLSEDGGAKTVTASISRASSAETVLTVSASPASAVTVSGNNMLTIPAGRTVSVDSVMITGVDNDDQTGDVSVTVSAMATNPSDAGVIAPEPIELAIVDDETTPKVALSLSSLKIIEGEDPVDVTAVLDNRSSVETRVVVSALPAEFVDVGRYVGEFGLLVIPAGQTSSSGWPVPIVAVDDDVYTETEKTVTVSGTATNSRGVIGPESVTFTIDDDERPIFREASVSYTFTAGVPANRILPEAEHGNGPLTYSISPEPTNGLTFIPGPPARVGVSATATAADETNYVLTATDAEGDTGTMTVTIALRNPVCPGSTSVSGDSAGGLVADCEALLSARDTLGGGRQLNWDENLPIGEWQGIEIARGRVAGIEMTWFGLAGTIADELATLTNLRFLNLGGNGLTGTIPPELGSLPNLTGLSLWRNRLTGSIPPELGNLTKLHSLELGSNRLTGIIPPELGNLSNLGILALWFNQLAGPIPPELGSLTNLGYLHLGGNELKGSIPPELSGLAKLQSLYLLDNQLTGTIPSELGDLTNLQRLFLSGNELSGCIPVGLRDVADDRPYNDPDNDLHLLDLPFCDDRKVLVEFYHATDGANWTNNTNWLSSRPLDTWHGVTTNGERVTQLHLPDNRLSGQIPPQLDGLTDLTVLRLDDNQLTGSIPPELGNLAKLAHLILRGNQLTGEIPSEPGAFSNLTVLSLAQNRLTGEIPLELGDLSNLERLILWGNQLTGEIPSELGDLSNLEELYLNDNRLTGEIPPELGGISNLTELWISQNQLNGKIPLELGDLSNLKRLYLWGNQLTGEIPPKLGKLSNLAVMILSENQLTGSIPPELGDLANLMRLNLNDNRLTGNVPAELGNLANLERLIIQDNQLTGELPQNLKMLTLVSFAFYNNPGLCAPVDDAFQAWLRDIEFVGGSSCAPSDSPEDRAVLIALYYAAGGATWTNRANWLSGRPIREWHGVNTDANGRVDNLYLSRNALRGIIPAELGGLANLQALVLSGNQLTGEIPPELGDLASLTALWLSQNMLTGEIPSELGRLSELEILSLQENHLSGDIPEELSDLVNLRTVRLSKNQLSGCVPPGLRDVAVNDFVELGLLFCEESLLGRYDADGDGAIDRSEMIRAINDFLFGVGAAAITREDMIAVINLYLFG